MDLQDHPEVRPPLTPPYQGGEPDRLKSEQSFHDEQAQQRRAGWEHNPALLHFVPGEYLDHEPWIRPAMAGLGELTGRRVLDFGCGHGMASTCLAKMGAEVVAFDVSAGYVHEACERARVNGVNVQGVVADGARLPWADETFDAVWGVAILHHLDMEKAASEVRRVLKPGGVGVFCEPWGGNPVLRWARHWLPYVGKERTADEEPLQSKDLATLRQVFTICHVEYVQLLGMIRRAWRGCPFLGVLDRFDEAMLKHWPAVRGWCRYVVVEVGK